MYNILVLIYIRGENNMDRMKTFFKYALLIVGFFILSLILENGLIMGMYGTITGNTNMSSNSGLDIQLED